MPDFHNNLFFITALTLIASNFLGPQQLVLLLQPDFLMHSYHYHQYFLKKVQICLSIIQKILQKWT